MQFLNFVLLLILNVAASFSSNATSFSNNTIPDTPKTIISNMGQNSDVRKYAEGGQITDTNIKEPNSSNRGVTEKV